MRPMAKETHIKTDKKTVGGWGAWELRYFLGVEVARRSRYWIFPWKSPPNQGCSQP